MALVAMLRGVNVGGHRRFRPAALAAALEHLGVVNVGAAGTFVVRRPIRPERLRAELARRLPFATEIVLCRGQEVARLIDLDPFAGHPPRPGVVHFVSVLARRPRATPPLPFRLPASGRWLLRVLGRQGRFVYGLYRREMKVITHLGALDRLFGAPATTRSWGTLAAIAKALEGTEPRFR